MDTMIIMTLNFAAVLSLMLLGWGISLIQKNVTIVDSLWGLGFVLIAWLTFSMAEGFYGRKLLIALLVSIWGLRLSLHLSLRNWGMGEDPRYGSWRKRSGNRFWLVSLYKVFILQSVFLWTISLGIQFSQVHPFPDRFVWLDLLGTLVWTVGFLFETVGDWQLFRFKSDPTNKGRVMDKGLWGYSRHPNYFGECLVWWGFFLIALSNPLNWWAVVSPLTISAVLLKMTGIPITESRLLKERPQYAAYVERTSAFIPWFPKKSRFNQAG